MKNYNENMEEENMKFLIKELDYQDECYASLYDDQEAVPEDWEEETRYLKFATRFNGNP